MVSSNTPTFVGQKPVENIQVFYQMSYDEYERSEASKRVTKLKRGLSGLGLVSGVTVTHYAEGFNVADCGFESAHRLTSSPSRRFCKQPSSDLGGDIYSSLASVASSASPHGQVHMKTAESVPDASSLFTVKAAPRSAEM